MANYDFGPFDRLRDPRPLSPSKRRLLFNQSSNKHNRNGDGSQITNDKEDNLFQRRLDSTLVGHLLEELGLAQTPTHEDDNQHATEVQEDVRLNEVHEVKYRPATDGKRRVLHQTQRGETTDE